MNNLSNRILQGFKWTALRSGGEEFIHLVVFLVLSRLLNPEDFGLISMALIFIGFLTLFADQGFGSAIIQKKEIEKEHLDSSFWFNFTMGVIFFLLFFFCADFIANFFDQPQLRPVIQFLSFSFIIKALEMIPNSILTKNLEFRLLAIRSLIAALISGIVGVIFALLDFGVYSLVAHRLTLSLTSVLAIWWLIDWRPSFSFSLKHLRDLWSFGIGVTIFKITSNLHGKVFDGIVGYFLGASTLGYFTIAFKIAKHLKTLLAKTTSRVLFPVYSTKQNDRKLISSSFTKINKHLMSLIMPLLVLLGINATALIDLIFGAKWILAGNIFAVLNIWLFLELQNIFFKQSLLSIGKAGYVSKFSILYLIIMAVGVYAVIGDSWIVIASIYTMALFMSMGYLLIYSYLESILVIKSYLFSFRVGFINSIVFIVMMIILSKSYQTFYTHSAISMLSISVLAITAVYSINVYLKWNFFKRLYKQTVKAF